MKGICVLLSCLVSLAFSQACNTTNTCATCTAIPECGWCAATQTCLDGDKSSPSNAYCLGEHAWITDSQMCKSCSSVKGCKHCVLEPNCQWCVDESDPYFGGTCTDFGQVCNQPRTNCPCTEYIGCAECREFDGCTWCGADQMCVDRNNIPPELGNCELTDVCTCTDAKDCYQCKDEDGCGYCESTKSCHSLLSFPLECAPSLYCPPTCVPDQCGERECGPFDGCGGYCGTCPDSGQYCNSDGYCKKFPNKAGNFVGGMFLGFGLVIILLVVYYFYKKKQGGNYDGLN